ncbi:aldehyde dehydrogenase (NADP(+)), partial [Pseudomonas syringae]
LFKADVSLLLNGDQLLPEEVFGPTTLLIEVADDAQVKDALQALRGQLTATVIGEPADLSQYSWLQPILEEKVGRILFNGYPTGVEVCEAMVHGGPYPATSDARGTSVGTPAIDRFLRPVCDQTRPDRHLPPARPHANPLGLARRRNGEWREQPVA